MGGYYGGPPPVRTPPDPIKHPDTQAHTILDRHLTHKLKTYSINEPPFKPEKATTLGIVRSIMATASTATDTKTRHVADLVQLGLYFCLRLCESNK